MPRTGRQCEEVAVFQFHTLYELRVLLQVIEVLLRNQRLIYVQMPPQAPETDAQVLFVSDTRRTDPTLLDEARG